MDEPQSELSMANFIRIFRIHDCIEHILKFIFLLLLFFKIENLYTSSIALAEHLADRVHIVFWWDLIEQTQGKQN